MTDDNDLVKRLRLKRERCHDLSGVYYTEDADCQAAADRIEELERILSSGPCEIAAHSNSLTEYMFHWEGRALDAEAKLAKAVEALTSVIDACDQGRMIPRPGHGAGGMTIEANVKGSIYTGVPAWPIEEARTAFAELKGDNP